METQVTFKGTESDEELESRIAAFQARLDETVPDARLAKYVVEERPSAHAVGLVLTLADGASWVRHAEGSDWERAFLDLERRLDRLAGED